ncbi:MAG: hypothetical protein H8E46_07685 [FCB group bacterium]|nr:hypothetical protein [FCB group bacterium]
MTIQFRKLFILLALISLLGVISGCDESGESTSSLTVPADFLPKQGDIEGWTLGTNPGDLREAADYNSLYAIMNGGAETFINHGFTEGVHQNYYGSISGIQKMLSVLVYDMGDSTGAAELFHDTVIQPPSSSPLDYGDEGRLDEGGLFDYTMDFRQDKYYVELSVNKEGVESEALQVLQLFASEIENNMN